MGHFDKSICDCCVCPMQCVLKQLVGQLNTLVIFTPVGFRGNVEINSVDNFIANTSSGMNAICNISAVGITFNSFPDIALKPIRQDKKGECSCCEDPMTNELKPLIEKEVEIEFNSVSPDNPYTGTISKVGEGIVILSGSSVIRDIAISTCQITRIEETS